MSSLALLEKEQTITSLEVAEMVGKRHTDLLRDIRRYCEQLNESNIALVDFFQESAYTDGKGENRPCYEVTKKGCEFIAHKLTGQKGTEFTAKYINRFHIMEEHIKSGIDQNLLEQSVYVLRFVAEDMRVNDVSRLIMYENLCKDFNIPTGFLPKYERNGNKQMKSATALLKENNCGMSAKKFNLLMIDKGYLEIRERPSSKTGETKKFPALTESGLKYGENAVSPKNMRETQPLYYEDTFMELYKEITN